MVQKGKNIMDKKTTDIVSYLTWVGLIIAFVIGDREKSKFHLNQSLVLWLAGTVIGILTGALGRIFLIGAVVSIIGSVCEVFLLICWFIGFIGAIQGTEKPVPFLGQFKLLK